MLSSSDRYRGTCSGPVRALVLVDAQAGADRRVAEVKAIGSSGDDLGRREQFTRMSTLSAGTRSVLKRRIGADLVRDAAAERLPLDDGSVDLVVFAQSWHWAQQVPAAAEARRVLARGGVLAMMWNHRDREVEWVRDLLRAEDPDGDPAEPEYLPALAGFGLGTERTFGWADTRTADEYLDLVCTHSSIAVLDESARAERLNAIHEVLQLQPSSRDGRVTIPQRCAVWTYPHE